MKWTKENITCFVVAFLNITLMVRAFDPSCTHKLRPRVCRISKLLINWVSFKVSCKHIFCVSIVNRNFFSNLQCWNCGNIFLALVVCPASVFLNLLCVIVVVTLNVDVLVETPLRYFINTSCYSFWSRPRHSVWANYLPLKFLSQINIYLLWGFPRLKWVSKVLRQINEDFWS